MASEEIEPAELLQLARRQTSNGTDRVERFLISVTAIDFTDIPIGDADLAPVAKLPYLRTVVLRGTKVTDAGLAVFKDCQHLETVDLSHSVISGTGLRDLHFSPIRDLNLSNSKFGDRGIANLVEIGHHLLRLNLAATQITDEGLERLKRPAGPGSDRSVADQDFRGRPALLARRAEAVEPLGHTDHQCQPGAPRTVAPCWRF